jgi:transcription elongation factor SPT5
MRGGGKFLRPGDGNAPFFDDDSSDDDSDDSGVNEENAAPVAKMNSNANLSSSDDDSDDDSDNDKPIKRSRSEDERVSSKASKKARSARSFFDEEAEASDDDEEEDDDDDDDELGTRRDPNDRVKKVYTQEDIRRENMDDEALELINRQNKRRQQLLKFTGDEDIADVAKRIEERHKMESRRVDRAVLDDVGIDEGNSNLATVTQQSLLPSVSDPSLWMFNCPNGKEQELVIQIMNKSIAYASQGKPLGITSAVAAQSKGRVYIESYSEPAVKEAVQGIRGLMQYSMKLVPISDMTTVMTVTSKSKPGKKY